MEWLICGEGVWRCRIFYERSRACLTYEWCDFFAKARDLDEIRLRFL